MADTRCEKCGGSGGIVHRIRPTIKNGRRIDKIVWCQACGTPPGKLPDFAPTVPILDALETEVEEATKVADLKAVLKKIIKHLKRNP